MRRALRLPCLAVALVVGVLGSGTVMAQVADAPAGGGWPAQRVPVNLAPPSDALSFGWSSAAPGPIETSPVASVTAVAIEDFAVIVGPPSLDIRPAPNMIYVGSASGVIYAVEASF